MDLRVKKTKAAIEAAFFQLRAKKPLERISVKELAEAAHINKATFYLHYRDMYDLSDALENAIIREALKQFRGPESFFLNPEGFTAALFGAFSSHGKQLKLLMADNRSGVIADKLERLIKEFVFEQYPRLQEDPDINILLSFMIQGSFHAFHNNRRYPNELIERSFKRITQCVVSEYSTQNAEV